jgi:hypothetical protein
MGNPVTVTKDLGDVNDGNFRVNLSVGPVRIDKPDSGVAFNSIVVNAGHAEWNGVNDGLKQGGSELARQGTATAVGAVNGTARPGVGNMGVELNDRELALVLAGLFELRLTTLETDATCAQIEDLAEKLHGDRRAMYYGAHRHPTEDECTPPCD